MEVVSAKDGVLDFIDNYDREAGVYARAGVGRAAAHYSVFEADAKGPNAAAEAGVTPLGVQAIARAEIA
ncbi:hypothetical protein Z043_117216, partial [Scleropages formosus]